MENSDVPKDAEISWDQLPWAQPTVNRLKALFDTSSIKQHCSFEDYTEDLRELKAPKPLFRATSAKFIEGQGLASILKQQL